MRWGRRTRRRNQNSRRSTRAGMGGAGGGASHFGPQLESFLLMTRGPTELRILRFVKERRETLIGWLDGNPSF